MKLLFISDAIPTGHGRGTMYATFNQRYCSCLGCGAVGIFASDHAYMMGAERVGSH